MNIEDFKKDADELISVYMRMYRSDTYLEGDEDYSDYLKTWLKIRNYTDIELEFLSLVIIRALDPIPEKFIIPGNDLNVIQARLVLLRDILPKRSYPNSFDEVSGDFVRYKEKFMSAEKWAYNLRYIDQAGQWNQTKGSLGAFIRILQKLEIVTVGKGTARYFGDRYGKDDISDQMKTDKAEKFEKRLLNLGMEHAIKFPKNE